MFDLRVIYRRFLWKLRACETVTVLVTTIFLEIVKVDLLELEVWNRDESVDKNKDSVKSIILIKEVFKSFSECQGQ